MALLAFCAFGAFLFVATLYLQEVRGHSALTAGLCLIPLDLLIVLVAPVSGRIIGARGTRLPLVVAGSALALGGVASLWLGPASPLVAVLGIYLLFGIFQGTINAPITNTAVSGMPGSMAGLATSVASSGRQTGITLGVAIAGTIIGTGSAADGVWWMVTGLGVGILALSLVSTGRWARASADRAADLFEQVERGPTT